MVKVDRKTVIQILGTLMQKPSLLSDTDKYQIEPSDFSMPLDRYIYSAIYHLYAGGAEKIRTVDIDTYLQSNDAAAGLIEKENGIAFMQDCEAYCEPENFNYLDKILVDFIVRICLIQSQMKLMINLKR